MRYSKAFAALFVVFGLAGSAHAAPQADSKRAAQSFAVGKSAFARGEYSVAAAAFEQASQYSPHPAPLLNAAEAWELAGNPVRAAEMCDRVFDIENLDDKFRQAAMQQLAKVTPKIATLEVKLPDGARGNVDGAEVGAHKMRLSPGAHTVSVTYSGGTTRSETVTLAAGAAKQLDMTNPAPEPAAAPPPSEKQRQDSGKGSQATSSSGPPLGTWISFGVAAVAGGVATFSGLRTVDARNKYNETPTEQTRDEFKSARLMTNVFIGVAAAGAVVGVVLWATSGGSEPSKTARDAMAGVIRF